QRTNRSGSWSLRGPPRFATDSSCVASSRAANRSREQGLRTGFGVTGPMSEPFAQYPHGPYLPYGQYPEPPRRHRGRTLLGLTATAIVAAGVGAGTAVGLSHGTTPGSTATSTSKNELTTAQIASRVNPAIVDVTSTLGYQQATAKGTGIVLTS